MSSLQGTEHAIRFNFLLCRELVVKVNVAVQERNVTYRIAASVERLMWKYISPNKNRLFCLSRWQRSNSCYNANDVLAHPLYLLRQKYCI